MDEMTGADPDTATTAAASALIDRYGLLAKITAERIDLARVVLAAARPLIEAEARASERQLQAEFVAHLKRFALSWAASGEPAALECARQLADLLEGDTR